MMLEKWVDIAKEVGAISDSGQEHSSSDMASQAIEILLGKGLMRDAVHYYVAGKPGSELLRGVLWQLHPYSAMEECYAIFKNSKKLMEVSGRRPKRKEIGFMTSVILRLLQT